MRLFLARGYDATTVNDVAAAAEVSSMTVFRYFPTKEHLVLTDEFDPQIAERIVRRPAGEPLMHRIGMGLIGGVGELTLAEQQLLLRRMRLIMETPALRARQWESQYASQKVIVDALGGGFRVQVTAAACLAAASAAITRWAADNGRCDLRELMELAFATLTEEGTP